MTVNDTYDNFILSRQLAGLSEKTILNYQQFVSPFIAFVGLSRSFETLKQDDITLYLQKLLKKPLSKATRSTYIRHLKIYLRWCENEYGAGYSSRLIRVPKTPKRNVLIYSDDEVCKIFNMIHAETPWLTYRNKCIIALMYDSGLRQSEVCSLRTAWVSFSDNRLVVRGKGDKERTVPMGKLTKRYMLMYLEACPYQLDYVFCSRNGSELTCNAVKQFVSKLANELPFDLSSHKLRHNFATNYCLDQYDTYGQVDIYRLMYLMGHEEIETTRRYLHLANEIIASRGCISHLDEIFSGEN